MISKILVVLAATALPVTATYTLVQSFIVHRHGARSPYPPPNGTLNDYSSYSPRIFPNASDWGMTEDEYQAQDITPHGKYILQLLGTYYQEYFNNKNFPVTNCNNMVVYADDSSENSNRDFVSGVNWLLGFGCPNVPVHVVNTTSYPDMQPVLSDHCDNGCVLATEEQGLGQFGGDVDALTYMYEDGIQKVQDILQMPANSVLCRSVNPDFQGGTCTFFDTGYVWTGLYYEGGFTSPLYYAQYFPELWMLQYVSNVSSWAWGDITLNQLTDLYNLHIKNFGLGTNWWNSQAYSSQQLAYIVASFAQRIKNENLAGIREDKSNQMTLLFSHDSNILYLGQLLDIDWIPQGYGTNIASTGGALHFELYQDGHGRYYVLTHYDAASPDQQRQATVLSLDVPPSIATMVIPQCGVLYCPFERFAQIALSVINMTCINEPLQTTTMELYNEYFNIIDDDGSTSSSSSHDGSKLTKRDWRMIFSTTAVLVALFVVGLVAFMYFSDKSAALFGHSLKEPLVRYNALGSVNDGAEGA